MVLELDGVIIPYTKIEEIEFYPIRYMLEKFLLKSNMQLHKKEEYKEFIVNTSIDFSSKGTVPQNCNCMNRNGWVKFLNGCRANQNKTEQKYNRYMLLCEYFNVDVRINNKTKYDKYTLSCIDNYKRLYPEIDFKKCVRCDMDLPNCDYFYNKDTRGKSDITNVCRRCNGGEWLTNDKFEKFIYDNYKLEGFELYKNDFVKFYKKYVLTGKTKFMVDKSENKNEKILNIIKMLYDDGFINNDDLTKDILANKLNLSFKGFSLLSNNDIIECCIADIKDRPWKHSNYRIGILTRIEYIEIFNRYICENNIEIENKFEFNGWQALINKCRIRNASNGDLLGFIVDFYKREYAGYLFNIASSNYYKNKDNLIFDMKYLIEKDLCVPIEKIPLYVTKSVLHSKSKSLYRQFGKSNNVFKSLFDWIDACYPGKFIISDFDLNPYRSKFDSLEEGQVYEEISKLTKGIIYNPRDSENRVELYGMIPDFIIHTSKGCYLTEYFGLYTSGHTTSHRLHNYKLKHDLKIEKYKKLEGVGYKSLFIYPDDLKNDFENLKIKINNII